MYKTIAMNGLVITCARAHTHAGREGERKSARENDADLLGERGEQSTRVACGSPMPRSRSQIVPSCRRPPRDATDSASKAAIVVMPLTGNV